MDIKVPSPYEIEDSSPYTSTTGESQFLEFEYRMRGLHRFIELNKVLIKEYDKRTKEVLEEYKKTIDEDEVIIQDPVFPDMTITLSKDDFMEGYRYIKSEYYDADVEYAEEYVCGSALTLLLSLLDNLLKDVTAIEAEENKIDLDLENKSKTSKLERRIIFLEERCGYINILNGSLREELALMVQVRNHFVHKLNSFLPKETRDRIDGILSIDAPPNVIVNNEFLERSFGNVIRIVNTIEVKYSK